MDLAELAELLKEKKESIQEWYDTNISSLTKKEEDKTKEIDETYPGDDYSDIRATKKEELQKDIESKKEKYLEKMNEKISAATATIDAKIEKFNQSLIEEQEALVASVKEIQEEKIKKAAEYKLKLMS